MFKQTQNQRTFENNDFEQYVILQQPMIIKAKQRSKGHKQLKFISFANAFYQGQYDVKQKKVEGEGILYYPNHHLIISQLFDHVTVSKKTVFYRNHNKFMFGNWNMNKPEGILQVRLEQAIIIIRYVNGHLSDGGKIIMLLEKYNLGVVLQIVQDQWVIVEKQQVYCKQQFENLLRKYSFKESKIQYSLVGILNDLISDQKNKMSKLRMVEDRYYQYGFQNGLNFQFDEGERLIHVQFNQHMQYHVPENRKERELVSIKMEQFLKKQNKIDCLQPGHIYRRSAVGQTAINEYFMDPSEEYFQYFQKLVDQSCIKKLSSGFIKNSLSPDKNHKNSKYVEMVNEMIEKQQKDQVSLKSKNEKDILKKIDNKIIQKDPSISEFELLSSRKDSSYSFEELPQRYKLNIMKKQQQQIINHKCQRYVRENINMYYKNTNNKQLNLPFFDPSPIDQLSIIKRLNTKQMVNKQTNTESPFNQNLKSASPNRTTRTRQKIFQKSPLKNNTNHTQSLFVYSDFLSPKQQQEIYASNQKERLRNNSAKQQKTVSEFKGNKKENFLFEQKTKSKQQISKQVIPDQSLFQSKQVVGSNQLLDKQKQIDVNLSPLKNKNYFLQKPQSRNTISYRAQYKQSSITPDKTILNSSSPLKKQRLFKYFKQGEKEQQLNYDYIVE